MKNATLTLVITTLLLGQYSVVRACSCATMSPKEIVDHDLIDVVFEGTVIKVEEEDVVGNRNLFQNIYCSYFKCWDQVQFKTIRAWKGVYFDRITVQWASSCVNLPSIGDKYLILTDSRKFQHSVGCNQAVPLGRYSEPFEELLGASNQTVFPYWIFFAFIAGLGACVVGAGVITYRGVVLKRSTKKMEMR